MLAPMKMRWLIAFLGLLVGFPISGDNLPSPIMEEETAPLYPVQQPTERLRDYLDLDAFYQKHVNVGGLPIVGSERVSDYALREAAYLIDRMIEGREDIRRSLVRNRVRFTVMAHNEYTTMMPEYADLQPRLYWNKRARGIGATPERPAVSCGEENLLCFEGDPYKDENILVHEFAHAIHEMGLNFIDPTFDRRLESAYRTAIYSALWKDKYASRNRREYWAEGVQCWFDTNRENDAEHNYVNTREELMQYDPGLANLVREVFGDHPWRYQRPGERPATGRRHLTGYDLQKVPSFAWPSTLQTWYDAYESGKELPTSGSGEAWTDLPVEKLHQVGPLRSNPSQEESSVMFLNRSRNPLKVYWVTPEGEQRYYGKISPGLRFLTTSYSGHKWLLTSEANEPLALVEATDKPGRAIYQEQ